ncbi:hypothetical protein OERS_04420 [Oerskovia enterophila]|uniref:Uncharacterized protein n=2 Tax=Oerskovia enterophila TaxID=43678 RepID=A0ABX2YFN8_9CELL|nr:hypothetical protein OERS_04420 [Oerskovia enterophila]
MAFIGDAVAHAVFLGLSVAFVRRGRSSSAGQPRVASWQSSWRVFFVAPFALGIVVISTAPGYAGSRAGDAKTLRPKRVSAEWEA